ncbi:unnamed protein product [Didymodactylos carnosus]|uniref:Ig-like domain-containing protein n=1 Tax=Didymodactylos carnosus TaxID=1234261 RepID=A0A8S2YVR2_9BILA|nr:unnamed protein product [Didymodactylos carnosus]
MYAQLSCLLVFFALSSSALEVGDLYEKLYNCNGTITQTHSPGLKYSPPRETTVCFSGNLTCLEFTTPATKNVSVQGCTTTTADCINGFTGASNLKLHWTTDDGTVLRTTYIYSSSGVKDGKVMTRVDSGSVKLSPQGYYISYVILTVDQSQFNECTNANGPGIKSATVNGTFGYNSVSEWGTN